LVKSRWLSLWHLPHIRHFYNNSLARNLHVLFIHQNFNSSSPSNDIFFTSFLFDKITLIWYKIPHYQCGFCAVSEKWYFLVYGAVFRDFTKSTWMVFHIISTSFYWTEETIYSYRTVIVNCNFVYGYNIRCVWISKVCKHFIALWFRIKLKCRRCTWLNKLKNRSKGVRNCKAAEKLFQFHSPKEIKSEATSLLMGRWIPIHKNSTMWSTF
jgi:hypothetical protein